MEELEKQLEGVELIEEEYKERPKTPSKREVYEKVVEFTRRIKEKYGGLIKSVVIFGSAAKGELKPTSDIDVWVILDDTTPKPSEDLKTVVANIHLLAEEMKDLHVQTTNLTDFWSWFREGSPELVNFLRNGLIVYDSGFVKPMQRMLRMGLIPPSEETVKLKSKSAEAKLKKIELDMRSMIFDLRYAAMDMIQAVVMHYYKERPDARAIPDFLKRLAEEKKLEGEFVEKFAELDRLWKDIEHKRIEKVEVEHLERAMKLSREIVERFKNLLPKEIIEAPLEV